MCGSELIEQRATNDAAPGTEHTSAKESKEVCGVMGEGCARMWWG